MQLREVTGPACPKCECRQSAIIQRWTDPWTHLEFAASQCRHCRHRWSVEIVKEPKPPVLEQSNEVRYPILEINCPACGSPATKVKSTRRPIRFHKCEACGHCFKSRETVG